MKRQKTAQKKKDRRGVLTVEAAIVLPIFIMVMVFVLSVMKLFYFHLVMQQALQNVGKTFSEYGYVLDEVVGLEKLNLTAETKEAEDNLKEKVDGVTEAVDNLTEKVDKGKGEADNLPQKVSEVKTAAQTLGESTKGEGSLLDKVEGIMRAGEELGKKFKALTDLLKDFKGNDNTKKMIINYFLVSALNEGEGTLIEWMIGDYLKEMHAQNGAISNIRYFLAADAHEGGGEVTGTKDIILTADYDYALNFFFFDKIRIRQSVRVHPWVGGETEGVKWGE